MTGYSRFLPLASHPGPAVPVFSGPRRPCPRSSTSPRSRLGHPVPLAQRLVDQLVCVLLDAVEELRVVAEENLDALPRPPGALRGIDTGVQPEGDTGVPEAVGPFDKPRGQLHPGQSRPPRSRPRPPVGRGLYVIALGVTEQPAVIRYAEALNVLPQPLHEHRRYRNRTRRPLGPPLVSPCLGEAAVYEVAAVLDVAEAASDALHEVVRGGEGDVGEPAATQEVVLAFYQWAVGGQLVAEAPLPQRDRPTPLSGLSFGSSRSSAAGTATVPATCAHGEADERIEWLSAASSRRRRDVEVRGYDVTGLSRPLDFAGDRPPRRRPRRGDRRYPIQTVR